jgi:hypothetical protein
VPHAVVVQVRAYARAHGMRLPEAATYFLLRGLAAEPVAPVTDLSGHVIDGP